jgi:hypothetical protein
MADSKPSKQDDQTIERNKRLDALNTAVTEWGEKEKKRLEDEVKFLKSVLNSRTGAGQLANQGVEDAKALLVDKIGQFLEG